MPSPGSSTNEVEVKNNTPYFVAGAVVLAAVVVGLAFMASRKPCPCAEHRPEAEAARIAEASAEVSLKKIVDEQANGKSDFPRIDQPERAE